MKGYISNETEPAISAFRVLKESKLASADYKMAGPYEIVARDGKYGRTKGGSENDMSAAFYNALMFHLTGKNAHADKAVEIINAYTKTLQALDGHDAPLCCLQGFMFVSACELMRDRIDNKAVKDMLYRAFVPTIDKFEANSPYANGNWGAIVNKMRMAIAIYTDNREMYEASKSYYLGGTAYGMKGFEGASDNGMLPYYISENGQCQETGRDQGHTQLGIGALAEACEVAWNQGDDLWGALDNRLLKGYEYTAKYNLGWDVPFVQWTDCTGLYNDWKVPGEMSRGKFSTIYEIAYNHYVGRKHLSMPYTAMVLGKAGGVRNAASVGNVDRVGVGALLFYQGTDVDMKSKAPGGKESPKMHQVYTYQAPDGAPLKHDYDVYIQPRGSKEWTKIDTYMAKVKAAPIHQVSEISYSYFDFVGDVFIKVVCKNKKFKTARVRPDYRGVICNIKNDS
ncbi:MAG: alginate lyase family protein, partial [Prevotellaceae bacterium]|nr:alginate lyase family protein [Prevotellaceae bacterium]